MRINGWHRLWISASLVGLVACSALVAALWPAEADIPHSLAFYDALDQNARSQIADTESGASQGVRMPNGHVIYLKPEVAASRKTEALFQYQQAVATALRSKQRLLLARVVGSWAIVTLTVLSVGHLFAWVVRGFRGESGRPTTDHVP